jgi:hypothetical protein
MRRRSSRCRLQAQGGVGRSVLTRWPIDTTEVKFAGVIARSGISIAKSASTAKTRLVMSSEVRPTSRRFSSNPNSRSRERSRSKRCTMAPRLVFREHLCLPCLGLVVARIDVGEGLFVGVWSARQGTGKSFGARRSRRPVVVWLPAHRRDLQWRSLPRIDPAPRRAPTRPAKRIRAAATVCYPQRDVFIEGRALDWIPAIVHLRRRHYKGSSRCPTIAGLSGFFTLIQSRDRPDR